MSQKDSDISPGNLANSIHIQWIFKPHVSQIWVYCGIISIEGFPPPPIHFWFRYYALTNGKRNKRPMGLNGHLGITQKLCMYSGSAARWWCNECIFQIQRMKWASDLWSIITNHLVISHLCVVSGIHLFITKLLPRCTVGGRERKCWQADRHDNSNLVCMGYYYELILFATC